MNKASRMIRLNLLLPTAFIATLLISESIFAQGEYFPPKEGWQRKDASEVGMDPAILKAAIDLALENTVVEPSDMTQFVTSSWGEEPFFSILGPIKNREQGSGMIIKNGYVVGEWGDLEREDMTFSVTKSYLSVVAGLAIDNDLIEDTRDLVKDYFPHESFNDPHNENITWDHFLTQTSDWSGTLWGKPDWADRPTSNDPAIAINREMHRAGTFFKYNDTRVNMLSYSLLNIFAEPLDGVLKERIMDPIGASSDWEWHGYENSWTDIGGQTLQSPSGGGHWGGGLFISTMDHARFGYLLLRKGNWGGQQLISENWIKKLQRPSSANRSYSYLWWLNFENRIVSNAPTNAFYASGAGGNYIWVDRQNDLLVVMRWVPNMRPVISAITDSIN